MHPHEPFGLANTAPPVQMLQDRNDLLFGQLGSKQRRPFAFGEPAPARAALQDPVLLSCAVAAMHAEVVPAPKAVVLTSRFPTAKGCEVVHGEFEPVLPAKENKQTRFHNLQRATCSKQVAVGHYL
jgi:hypothetical protein